MFKHKWFRKGLLISLAIPFYLYALPETNLGRNYESAPVKNWEMLNSANPYPISTLEAKLGELRSSIQMLIDLRDNDIVGSPRYVDLDKNIYDLEKNHEKLSLDLKAIKVSGKAITSQEYRAFSSDVNEMKDIATDLSQE